MSGQFSIAILVYRSVHSFLRIFLFICTKYLIFSLGFRSWHKNRQMIDECLLYSSIDIPLWVVRVTGTCVVIMNLEAKIFRPKKIRKRRFPSLPNHPQNRQWNTWWNLMRNSLSYFLFSIILHWLASTFPEPYTLVFCAPWRFFHMHLLRLSKPPGNPRIPPVPDVSTHGLLHSRHRWWAGYCEDIGLQICFRRAQQNRHLGAVTTWKWVGGSERGRCYIISDTLR